MTEPELEEECVDCGKPSASVSRGSGRYADFRGVDVEIPEGTESFLCEECGSVFFSTEQIIKFNREMIKRWT